jgi:alkyldihydroxyacetonephosphate synthase
VSADEEPVELAAALAALCGAGEVSRGEGAALRVRPGSAAEVGEVVALVSRRGGRVAAVGGGATGAASPDDGRPLVLCDLRRLHHVLHLDEASLTVHVQAGITGVALEQVLAPRDLTLGDLPPSALGATIGGLLSVRTPGKASARTGTLEDAVLGVSAVLADGRTIHTRVAPRRATGPDLARVLLGSAGSLGILTAATLRIHRRPEARLVAAYLLPSIADALAAVRLAFHEEAAPAAVRIYDADEARIHLGEDVAPGGEAVLVVATAGPTDLAACDRDLFASAAAASGGRPTADEVAQRWWRLRTGLDRRELPRPALQIAASPRQQVAVYDAVRAAAGALGHRVRGHASRLAADGGVFFFSFATADDAPLAPEALAQAVAAAEAAGRAAGGALLGALPRADAALWRALEAELDPRGTLAPDPPALGRVLP